MRFPCVADEALVEMDMTFNQPWQHQAFTEVNGFCCCSIAFQRGDLPTFYADIDNSPVSEPRVAE